MTGNGLAAVARAKAKMPDAVSRSNRTLTERVMLAKEIERRLEFADVGKIKYTVSGGGVTVVVGGRASGRGKDAVEALVDVATKLGVNLEEVFE